jgi:hypothetical protein
MMATVQMAGNGFGGIVQGNYGTYQSASDGTFTVDVRDAPAMLVRGMTYVNIITDHLNLSIPPAAATIGAIVASGALSNGNVAVTANPDVPRVVNVEVGAGTSAITAGTVAVTYTGNDGVSATETLSLVAAANTSTTQALSRGVVTISNITVSGLTGGASPWLRMSTTSALSMPVSKGAVDFAVIREWDSNVTAAIGTLSPVLASITPTNVPNATRTYSFVYTYVTPSS